MHTNVHVYIHILILTLTLVYITHTQSHYRLSSLLLPEITGNNEELKFLVTKICPSECDVEAKE